MDEAAACGFGNNNSGTDSLYAYKPDYRERNRKNRYSLSGTEELIEITDPVRLQAVKEEINSSKREGTEEFELAEGHTALLRFDDGSEWEMTFYPSGHAVIEGYCVRSELEDFCGE